MKLSERESITFYMNKEEYKLIEEAVKKKSLSMSSFCRLAVLKFAREQQKSEKGET